MGSWVLYGLGSESRNLPGFVVLTSVGGGQAQPIAARQWSSGFLPGHLQGVEFQSAGDPVHYVRNLPGSTAESQKQLIQAVNRLNQLSAQQSRDPEIATRIEQYELAFRMQASVPELADLSGEPEHVFELYGKDSKVGGTFAASALMARRLLERGTRFVQIFHRGWDQHGSLPRDLTSQCKDVDQGVYGLIQDLKQRGMLEDTLVVFGGEFGRTIYCQGALSETDYGRDHHPRCFSLWLAGGGIKGGVVHGETDQHGIAVARDGVHVHDFHATILHLMGLNHERLTYRHAGRDFRLTDVEGNVVRQILA